MEINRTQIPSTEPERQYYYIEQAKKYVKKASESTLLISSPRTALP